MGKEQSYVSNHANCGAVMPTKTKRNRKETRDRRRYLPGLKVGGGAATIIESKMYNEMKRKPFGNEYLIEFIACAHREWIRHHNLWVRSKNGLLCRTCFPDQRLRKRSNPDQTEITHVQAHWPAPHVDPTWRPR
jgi:hypothetical protein